MTLGPFERPRARCPDVPRLERFPLNLKVAYIDHGGLGERRGPAGPAGPGRPDVPWMPWSGGEGGAIAGGLPSGELTFCHGKIHHF